MRLPYPSISSRFPSLLSISSKLGWLVSVLISKRLFDSFSGEPSRLTFDTYLLSDSPTYVSKLNVLLLIFSFGWSESKLNSKLLLLLGLAFAAPFLAKVNFGFCFSSFDSP